MAVRAHCRAIPDGICANTTPREAIQFHICIVIRIQVIYTDNLTAILREHADNMRTNEACAPGYKDVHFRFSNSSNTESLMICTLLLILA